MANEKDKAKGVANNTNSKAGGRDSTNGSGRRPKAIVKPPNQLVIPTMISSKRKRDAKSNEKSLDKV